MFYLPFLDPLLFAHQMSLHLWWHGDGNRTCKLQQMRGTHTVACLIACCCLAAGPARPTDRMLPSKGDSGRQMVLDEAASTAEATIPVRRMLPSRGNGGRRLVAKATAKVEALMFRGRLLPSRGNGGRRLVAKATAKIEALIFRGRLLPSRGNGGRRLLA